MKWGRLWTGEDDRVDPGTISAAVQRSEIPRLFDRFNHQHQWLRGQLERRQLEPRLVGHRQKGLDPLAIGQLGKQVGSQVEQRDPRRLGQGLGLLKLLGGHRRRADQQFSQRHARLAGATGLPLAMDQKPLLLLPPATRLELERGLEFRIL